MENINKVTIGATISDIKKELWLRFRENGNLMWVTEHGNKVPIKELSLEHIINILRMDARLERDRQEYQDALEGYPGK